MQAFLQVEFGSKGCATGLLRYGANVQRGLSCEVESSSVKGLLMESEWRRKRARMTRRALMFEIG